MWYLCSPSNNINQKCDIDVWAIFYETWLQNLFRLRLLCTLDLFLSNKFSYFDIDIWSHILWDFTSEPFQVQTFSYIRLMWYICGLSNNMFWHWCMKIFVLVLGFTTLSVPIYIKLMFFFALFSCTWLIVSFHTSQTYCSTLLDILFSAQLFNFLIKLPNCMAPLYILCSRWHVAVFVINWIVNTLLPYLKKSLLPIVSSLRLKNIMRNWQIVDRSTKSSKKPKKQKHCTRNLNQQNFSNVLLKITDIKRSPMIGEKHPWEPIKLSIL